MSSALISKSNICNHWENCGRVFKSHSTHDTVKTYCSSGTFEVQLTYEIGLMGLVTKHDAACTLNRYKT